MHVVKPSGLGDRGSDDPGFRRRSLRPLHRPHPIAPAGVAAAPSAPAARGAVLARRAGAALRAAAAGCPELPGRSRRGRPGPRQRRLVRGREQRRLGPAHRRAAQAPGAHQRRGDLAGGAALPRPDGARREDAGRLRVDPRRREVRNRRPDPRPHRLGQGSRGAHDPRARAAARARHAGAQLRRAARHAVRVGDVRLREGRLHRRRRQQAGARRAGPSQHAVPRRNRRHVVDGAGQAAARAAGAALRAPRRVSAPSRPTSA